MRAKGGRLGRVELGHRRLLGVALAGVAGRRRLPRQQPGGVELHAHVGYFLLQTDERGARNRLLSRFLSRVENPQAVATAQTAIVCNTREHVRVRLNSRTTLYPPTEAQEV